jgi:hypothetical protein
VARKRQTERKLADLARKIDRILTGSPLDVVGRRLSELVRRTLKAIEARVARPGQEVAVIELVTFAIEKLPHTFGARFGFDAANISAIAEDWSSKAVHLSRMIVPRYGDKWGHATVTLPVDREMGYPVDVILMPGEDDLESVDLLSYPWLCHELGHNLHFQNDTFARCFQERLDTRLSGLRSRTVADTGTAKAKSLATIDRIAQHWTPTPDHSNWPYEIAVDAVAVWTVGPAFLAAFEYALSETNPDPHYLSKEHPPYGVRVTALVDAAQRLSWGDYSKGLERMKTEWQYSGASGNRTNEYVTLADEDLVMGAVTCALTSCKELALPQATPHRLDAIRQGVRHGKLPAYGSDVILAAWIAENDLSEDEYDSWERTVVTQLAASVRLGCH